MAYTQEQIEWLHDHGKMPDWAYYQQNDKSPTMNLFEQTKKIKERALQAIKQREEEARRKEDQKKQEKESNDMRNGLQVGDEITTIGGIIGKIVSIKDETVLIETSNERNKIRILRTAVRNVDVHAEDAE